MTISAARPLVLIAVAVTLVFAWLGSAHTPARRYSLDVHAQRYVDQGLKRALLTFGTARTLEGVISVAQATALAFEPAGVGVQLGPGQALRPIGHLIGQFAELTLIASIAFGAMEILLRIGGHWVISLTLSVALAGWATYRWRGMNSPVWLAKLVLVLLLVRFAVPIVSLSNEAVYAVFMADAYAENQQAIEASSENLGETAPAAVAQTDLFQRLREWVTQKADIAARLKGLVHAAENVTETVVRLMVIFVLQTLVIPVVLAWALVKVTAGMLQIRARPRDGGAHAR